MVRFGKTGLVLAAMALFFVVAVLPFHSHDHSTVVATSNHCAVCAFSGHVKSLEGPVVLAALLRCDRSVVPLTAATLSVPGHPVFQANPRAPPAIS